MTMAAEDDAVVAAMRAGARGYVVKGAGRAELIQSVQTVAAGGAVFSASVADRLGRLLRRPRRPPGARGRSPARATGSGRSSSSSPAATTTGASRGSCSSRTRPCATTCRRCSPSSTSRTGPRPSVGPAGQAWARCPDATSPCRAARAPSRRGRVTRRHGGVLLNQRVADGIRSGEVTLAFRRWSTPRVRPGGSFLSSVGVVLVGAVDEVGGATPDEARAAGASSVGRGGRRPDRAAAVPDRAVVGWSRPARRALRRHVVHRGAAGGARPPRWPGGTPARRGRGRPSS